MEDNESEIPHGLTPRAAKSRARYLQRYASMAQRTKGISFNILVWGPSPNSPSQEAAKVAQKRRDISNRLIHNGHNAMFSEDIPELSNAVEMSQVSKEYAQALKADLIYILIESAPGALAEAHDFCSDPKLVSKIYVLAPIRYNSGYSAQGALKDLDRGYGGVHWYEEGDIDKCNVMKRVIERTEARRNIWFRRGRTT